MSSPVVCGWKSAGFHRPVVVVAGWLFASGAGKIAFTSGTSGAFMQPLCRWLDRDAFRWRDFPVFRRLQEVRDNKMLRWLVMAVRGERNE